MTANPTVLAGLCPDPAQYHSYAHPEAPSCGNKSQDISHVECLNAGIVQGVHKWEKTEQNYEDTADYRDAPFTVLPFRVVGILRRARHLSLRQRLPIRVGTDSRRPQQQCDAGHAKLSTKNGNFSSRRALPSALV
jgi:hypothetical protein